MKNALLCYLLAHLCKVCKPMFYWLIKYCLCTRSADEHIYFGVTVVPGASITTERGLNVE